MTDDQIDHIVQHLCHQLHVAIRLRGAQPEVHPPNLKDLGFDPVSVRAVLLTGLSSAGVAVVDRKLNETTEAPEEPPWA